MTNSQTLRPRRVGRQIGLWEFEYEDELSNRIDAVFGEGVYAWIDAAWATMLIHQRILPVEHASKVASSILEYLEEQPEGYERFAALQAYVIKRHGASIGGSLTIGRTVPSMDQMTRVRRELLKASSVMYTVMDALLDLAGTTTDAVMPGYTHLRHAQPTTFGHYLLSVFDPLLRSMDRVEDSLHLMSLNELGCGALAGTSLPIDRELVSSYLALDGLIENTNDAVAYTDGYVNVVSALANYNTIMSRFALDLNVWSSEDVAFLEVPWVRVANDFDGVEVTKRHTHSHFMPNKTNNCPWLERTRVGAAHVLGCLTEVVTMGMRSPHADMHEMLHMADATLRAVEATSYYNHPYIFILPDVKIDRERMLAAARQGWSTATELGNRLVLDHSIDYTTAHQILNEFINHSKAAGIEASEASIDDLERVAETVIGNRLGISEKSLRESLDPEHFVKVTTSRGGVSRTECERMLADRREKMASAWSRLKRQVTRLEAAKEMMICELRRLAGSRVA